MQQFKFTFDNIKSQYQKVLNSGYTFMTCEEYISNRESLPAKVVVHRIDVDFSLVKARILGEIYNELGIKGTFFIRLHAPEYNPFSFENYRVVKFLIEAGHEIGYHSEIVDQAVIWDENEADCLLRDVRVMNAMYGIDVKGVASHGGMTGLNNLDFWKNKKAEDFGLLYEAYDSDKLNLWNNAFYISDSEWTRWKCYHQGKLVQGDNRPFTEHVMDGHLLIYLLIHSDTYYHHHFYE